MALVATLLPDQLRLNRLRTALRDRYTVIACGDWDHLLRVCADEPLALVVVDLFAGLGLQQAFDSLRQLQRRFPSVAIVMYVSSPPAQPRDLFEAGRFGLDGLIVADHDDEPRTMLRIIEQAEARGVLGLLLLALGDAKPTVRDATLIAVTRAHQRLSADGLARMLGIRRKTLSERLSQAGFPTTQRLIAWGRVIVAARMLEDNERSADGVALALDFPSGSAFRNTCQRYIKASPGQIRERGGAMYVIDCFLRQITATRQRRSGGSADTVGLEAGAAGATGATANAAQIGGMATNGATPASNGASALPTNGAPARPGEHVPAPMPMLLARRRSSGRRRVPF